MAKARKPAKPKKARGTHKTEKTGLTNRDIKFAQLLFDRDFVAPRKSVSQCYLEAGFPKRETDEATLRAAYRRVKYRPFREYYRKYERKAAAAALVTSVELLGSVVNFLTADRRELFHPTGEVKLPHEWPDDVAAVVEDFDLDTVSEVNGDDITQKVYVRKVRTVSRLAAAVKLMEFLKMIGSDADGPKQEQKPLVVNGADVNKL